MFRSAHSPGRDRQSKSRSNERHSQAGVAAGVGTGGAAMLHHSSSQETLLLHEGYIYKMGRKLTGRQCWRKKYFVLTGALLFDYKNQASYKKRERPEKVYRVDCPDGYVEDTGMIRMSSREHYCLTLCHRSITTGELKRLKVSSLRPEEAATWKALINEAREEAMNRQHLAAGVVDGRTVFDAASTRSRPTAPDAPAAPLWDLNPPLVNLNQILDTESVVSSTGDAMTPTSPTYARGEKVWDAQSGGEQEDFWQDAVPDSTPSDSGSGGAEAGGETQQQPAPAAKLERTLAHHLTPGASAGTSAAGTPHRRTGSLSDLSSAAGTERSSVTSTIKRRDLLRLPSAGVRPPELEVVEEYVNRLRQNPHNEAAEASGTGNTTAVRVSLTQEIELWERVGSKTGNHEDDEDSDHSSTPSSGGAAGGQPAEGDMFRGSHKRLTRVEYGLRFFESVPAEGDDPHTVPILEARGRVRAPPEAVFKLVMDLARSRQEWDLTFARGRVVKSVDGHTDIIHHSMRRMEAVPLGGCLARLQPAPRDFCLQRYWRRDDDGTYIILLRSHSHALCPPQPGYVRANLLGGGFIISPHPDNSNPDGVPDSLLMQMIEMHPRGWMPPRSPFSYRLYYQILSATGAVREAFDQMTWETIEKLWDSPEYLEVEGELQPQLQESHSHAFSSRCGSHKSSTNDLAAEEESAGDDSLPESNATSTHCRHIRKLQEWCKSDTDSDGPQAARSRRARSASLPDTVAALSAAADAAAAGTPARLDSIMETTSPNQPTRSAPSVSAHSHSQRSKTSKALKGGMHEGTLPHCQWPPKNGNTKSVEYSGFCDAPHTQFKVRSKRYLETKQKQQAAPPLMTCVASDWYKSHKRIDHLCGRKDGICQTKLLKDPRIAYVFAVNIQVPAQQHYSMITYFACPEPIRPESLLAKFINDGDEQFRNARFKLIPAVAKGPWVVQKSVGTTPLIVGGALKVDFHKGDRYFEVDIDIGSSAVANSVVRFVFGYARYICVDIAYLIQGNDETELPEQLLATIRVAHLNLEAAVEPPPEDYVDTDNNGELSATV